MKKTFAIAAAAIVCFALGFLVADARSARSTDDARPPIDLPAAATRSWFPPVGDYDTGGYVLDDERFARPRSTSGTSSAASPSPGSPTNRRRGWRRM